MPRSYDELIELAASIAAVATASDSGSLAQSGHQHLALLVVAADAPGGLGDSDAMIVRGGTLVQDLDEDGALS